MSIIVGSARIDENGHAIGGAKGDKTGKEVSTQNFYMHSKGWYCLRPKNVAYANKMATAMKNACDNNNIGYDQSNRAAVSMVKKYGSTKNIAEKTETDCSNLVRACIYEATGKDIGNFYTGNEVEVLEKSGLFYDKKAVSSANDVYNGDVLVTKTSGHTVIVVSGRARTSSTYTSNTIATHTTKVTKKVSDTKMPEIKEGSKGKAVKIWQIIVGVKADGIFGKDTKSSTKKFQSKHKLKEDGVVGSKTWKAGLESV